MFDLSQYFDYIVNWVSLHPHLTGLIIFLVAFLESLVVVGVIMPGAVLLISVGVLISMGKISFGVAVSWAIAGAIAGDGLSFWIGYYYKDKLRKIWPFSKYKKLLKRGEVFFAKHGGKSIVLGRFVGPVRAIVPTVAGMMGMSGKRFAFVNVLSAIAWAPAYILPGLVVGAVSQAASESAVRLVLMFFLIIVAVLLAHWLSRKLFLYLQARTEVMVVKTLSWGQKHPWFSKVTESLLQPESNAYRALIISSSILFLASIVFIVLVSFGINFDASSNVNTTINHFFRSLRTPGGDQVMTFITMLADPFVYGPLVIATGLWFGLKKHYQALFHLLFVIGFTALLVGLFKHGLATVRPDNALPGSNSSGSFPSAHTTMAAISYGFIAVLLANGSKSSLRGVPYLTAILIIISIAFSRLYLGVHWFSDVIGGLLIGLICLSITGISYQRHLHVNYSAKYLAGFVFITLIVFTSLNNFMHFESELKSYTPIVKIIDLEKTKWLAQDWRNEAAFRYDLRGRKDQPLNIQYVGDINKLKSSLLKSGWLYPAKFKFISLAHWLQAKPKLKNLPVLPQVNNGQHEQLLMTRQVGDQQFVLRLWYSNKKINPSGHRLYIGNSSNQQLKQQLGVFTYPETGLNFLLPIKTLSKDLVKFRIKRVLRKSSSNNKNIMWDKRVLLITP